MVLNKEVEKMIVSIFGSSGDVSAKSLRHDIGILCCGHEDCFHQFKRTGIEARIASDENYRSAIAKLAGIMENKGEKPKCTQ